jgi:hypothetical protein
LPQAEKERHEAEMQLVSLASDAEGDGLELGADGAAAVPAMGVVTTQAEHANALAYFQGEGESASAPALAAASPASLFGGFE